MLVGVFPPSPSRFLRWGDSFGITPTTERLYHRGVMRTCQDDCQFVCITQADYYKILREEQSNQRRFEDDRGRTVLVTEPERAGGAAAAGGQGCQGGGGEAGRGQGGMVVGHKVKWMTATSALVEGGGEWRGGGINRKIAIFCDFFGAGRQKGLKKKKRKENRVQGGKIRIFLGCFLILFFCLATFYCDFSLRVFCDFFVCFFFFSR